MKKEGHFLNKMETQRKTIDEEVREIPGREIMIFLESIALSQLLHYQF